MKRHSIVTNTLPLLSDFTGIGKYIYEISSRMQDLTGDLDFTYYYGFFRKNLFMPGADSISSEAGTARFLKKLLTKSQTVKQIARNAILFLSQFSSQRWDLYWEPNVVPIKYMKSWHLVTTVHDFSFHLHPEWHPRERREYFQKYFWNNIMKADRIITGSHFTKKEIGAFLGFDPEKVHVIHHGVDHTIFKIYEPAALTAFIEQKQLPHKFILFVGSIEPRKNLSNLLQAYASLSPVIKDEYKFVLAGFSGWNNAEVMKILQEEKKNVRYLGYLAERELAYLYNLATVFVYPSLYEGFGLPPLEAMACGTPVIVSNVASMPEVCGDAAYYIDPQNVDDIAHGICAVVTDDNLRRDLTQKGLSRSKSFSWDKAAREHLMIFKEVLKA